MHSPLLSDVGQSVSQSVSHLVTVRLPMTLLTTSVCIAFLVWLAHAKDMASGNLCVILRKLNISQALFTARLDRGA